jgi:hypothetical protein
MLLGSGFLMAVAVAAWVVVSGPEKASLRLPDRLSHREFWGVIADFSEPGGTFRSENLVSNESEFQRVIPRLKQRIEPGGVYLGVGPDQNFTYIGALQPRLAFIVDIRRENMLLHLMYKALFELSRNRAEFLSKLFARRPPNNLPESTRLADIFELYGTAGSDPALARETRAAILRQLQDDYRYPLSLEDSKTIAHIYNAFVTAGPEIRYSYPNQYAWRRFPSYSELMLETDGAIPEAENHSYMASESNFHLVKRLHSENRIIPIVGDFAGEKALRAVGKYVKDHGATISVFYTSNVEFYLFQSEDWRRFFESVSELPLNDLSTFIRSYFNNYSSQFPNPPSWLSLPPQSYTLLDSMPALVKAFEGRRIDSYYDVIRRSTPQ